MIYLGCYIPQEFAKLETENMLLKTSNAVTRFQMNLLEGLEANDVNNVCILNALPVGTWPRQYRKAYLEHKEYPVAIGSYTEAGTINIPVLKQISRYISAVRFLKRNADKEILIYSTYLPFLAAATTKRFNRKTTLIVADLPEYYDLESELTFFWKCARKIVSKLTYRYIARVDRFVLLTEAMYSVLNVGKRPYIVMEGIVSVKDVATINSNDDQLPKNKGKKIIMYSGTLALTSGILDLLNILDDVPDEDMELWICGAGEAEEMIRETASADTRLKYFGYLSLEEVAALQQQATILVNPRKPEYAYTKYSFPSKTMEYMLSGNPVVMYKLPGVPDEYSDYVSFVNQNESLVECIQRLLSLNEGSRYELGNRAREFVLKNKGSEFQTARLIDLARGNL